MVEEKQLQEQLDKLRADEAQLVEALFRCRGAIDLCEFLMKKPVSMAELGSMIGAKVDEPEPIA